MTHTNNFQLKKFLATEKKFLATELFLQTKSYVVVFQYMNELKVELL